MVRMKTQGAPANKLDPRAKSVWRIQALVGTSVAVLTVAVTAVILTMVGAPSVLWTVPAVIVLAGVVIALGPAIAIRYERWRWEVTELEVRLQHGLFVIQRTVIPMPRIQHVDTSQGPIMRAFDLSEVRVWTAAGSHAIPALSETEAGELRDRIATLARVSDDGGV